MILDIDLGSTLFKATVFDHDLVPVGEGQARVEYGPHGGNVVEMPVSETENAFRATIAEALRSAGVKDSELESIAIASQAQTFTVRSSAGKARVPFISWRDARSQGSCRAADTLTDFAEHCSVDQCIPLLMVSKLAWLQDQFNGSLVDENDLVLMLPTWFVQRLTGTAVVDSNLAAMSGLYSMQTGGWWKDALHVCGIRQCNLPALAELGCVSGLTTRDAQRYGLPPGIPVVLAGNDQTAGAYGANIHEQDAMLITLGTAQVVYVVCKSIPAPAPGVLRGPYPGGRGYQLVADAHGAGTVHWARTVLKSCASKVDFENAADCAAADCSGIRFIAVGPAGSGRWINETPQTNEADKARAVLLCLVDRMAEMLNRLQPFESEKRMFITGGGSNSDVWLECLQQRLGKTLYRLQDASPALGAARMARKHTHG